MKCVMKCNEALSCEHCAESYLNTSTNGESITVH